MIRSLLLLAGGLLAYNGYISGMDSGPEPKPINNSVEGDIIQVILSSDEEFPPEPLSEGVRNSGKPLVDLLTGSRRDSLTLARAWREWAVLASQSVKTEGIKNTQDFMGVIEAAHRTLLQEYTPDKDYQGSLTAIVGQVMTAAFRDASLTQPKEGGMDHSIANVAWSEACAKAAKEGLSALSHYAFKAYKETVKKEAVK